jgi:hypothetical protein
MKYCEQISLHQSDVNDPEFNQLEDAFIFSRAVLHEEGIAFVGNS